MNVFGIKELCERIAGYLPPASVLLLIKERIFCSDWKFNIKQLIVRRLVELGFDNQTATSLLNHLGRTNSFISGSFMVSVLVSPSNYALEWIPNDIDIYSGLGSTYAQRSIQHSNITDWLWQKKFFQDNDYDDDSFYDGEFPVISKTWKQGHMPKINEVIIDEDIIPVTEFICHTFDFDFCKIMYDGKKLVIGNIIDLVLMKCCYRGNALVRTLEYSVDVDDLTRCTDAFIGRKAKYEKRGFEIQSDYSSYYQHKNIPY